MERGISVIRRWTKRTATTRQKDSEYRSPIEEKVADQLKGQGFKNIYEIGRIPYVKSIAHYIPDFVLPNGIIIEVKGYPFESFDRSKHLYLKKQHPDLDVRFIFENPRLPIYPKSKTTYGDWCDKNGFEYAHAYVPTEWIREQPKSKRIRTLKEVLKLKGNARN